MVSGRLLLLRLSLFFLAGPGQCCHHVDKLISARTIQGKCATCILFLRPDEDDWRAGLGPRDANWIAHGLDYTGFPGDVCVAFFNDMPGNKNAVAPNTPHKRRKPSCLLLTTRACQDQLNTEFSKVCEKCKVRGIESLKYVREFYTPVCYCGDISTPLNMTQHKTKRDWLLYLSVIWPLGRALTIQSGQSSQTFSWLRETSLPPNNDRFIKGNAICHTLSRDI